MTEVKKSMNDLNDELEQNKLYQLLHNLINTYEPYLMISNFKNLGVYIKLSLESDKMRQWMSNDMEYMMLENSFYFYNNMEKFDLDNIKNNKISIYFEDIGKNSVFRKYFYKWYSIINLKN
jgi:hypothetical protein